MSVSARRRRAALIAAFVLTLTATTNGIAAVPEPSGVAAPTAGVAAPTAPVAMPGLLPVPVTLCGSSSLPGEWSAPVARRVVLAVETAAPDYYAIDLVPAGRVPGTRLSRGVAVQTFASSPFGVSLAPSGEYTHQLDISVTGLRPREGKVYAVWAATPELDEVVSFGALDVDFRAAGQVHWNKFLVFITLEDADAIGDTFSGPVILRGMSRSGRMHTMAGHGPFEAEPCAKYGYQ